MNASAGRTNIPGRKTFVLDTNVLLHDPNCLAAFEDNDLVIPITAIEELDNFKRDLNEIGRAARQVSRTLDKLRESGSLAHGVPLPNGGRLTVDLGIDTVELPPGLANDKNDHRILATVLKLRRERGESRVTLVTRDVNLRLKADALDVKAEDFEHAHIQMDEHYTGVTTRAVASSLIDEVHAQGWISAPWPGLMANQFVVLQSEESRQQAALTRYDPRLDRLRVLPRPAAVWGLVARNKEQRFALDLLLDDTVRLVTLDGIAGTGKTLLAIAAGLSKVTDDPVYRRLVVSRPIFPLGRDIGFLPGDIGEKLNPWMKPIFDNLELLLSGKEGRDGRESPNRRSGPPNYQALIDQGMIEVEPLTYIRGRSIPHQYLIIDEAQNLTPHEVKTVITRASEGTKVILTGDPNQIDNPYVDATSNGLTYVVEHFKGLAIAGHVTLTKGERSELAETAAQVL